MSRKTLVILPLALLCFLPFTSLPAFAAKHKKEKPTAPVQTMRAAGLVEAGKSPLQHGN